jgi:hypothetical protein
MTLPGPARQTLEVEQAAAWAEPNLGPRIAKRIGSFRDGGLFVMAADWAALLAWVVDFVVFLLGVGVGVLVVATVDINADLENSVVGVSLIAILFLFPLLYGGLCYRNGRGLGGVLTGTQVVRFADGGRLGGRAPWVMLVRTVLLPLLFAVVITTALAGGGSGSGSGKVRSVCVDVRATQRLRAAAGTP